MCGRFYLFVIFILIYAGFCNNIIWVYFDEVGSTIVQLYLRRSRLIVPLEQTGEENRKEMRAKLYYPIFCFVLFFFPVNSTSHKESGTTSISNVWMSLTKSFHSRTFSGGTLWDPSALVCLIKALHIIYPTASERPAD